MEHIHVALLFSSWDMIFLVIILIQYLFYRKYLPCFFCALEVLHQVIFFHFHIRVSFWYASKSWGFSWYEVELQPMDIVDDIKTHVEVCLVYLEQVIIIVFSLHLGEPLFLDLPMLAYIHCCTSQHSVPLFNFFYCVHISLVIMWFLIQWLVVLVYLSFLESSCFSWCFSLALGSMEFLIDSMP